MKHNVSNFSFKKLTAKDIYDIISDVNNTETKSLSIAQKINIIKRINNKNNNSNKINKIKVNCLFSKLKGLGLIKSINTTDLTSAGRGLLNKSSKHSLESVLAVSHSKLTLFKQLLKIKVYKPKQGEYIFPFLIITKFISHYSYIPTLRIHIILKRLFSQNYSSKNLGKMVNEYKEVIKNKISFNNYLNKYLPILSYQNYSLFNIFNIFCNIKRAKSSKTMDGKTAFKKLLNISNQSLPIVFSFVKNILMYSSVDKKKKHQIIINLISLSKSNTIRNILGHEKLIFKSNKRNKIKDFKEKYINSDKYKNIFRGKIKSIYIFLTKNRRISSIHKNSAFIDHTLALTCLFTVKDGVILLKNRKLWRKIFHYSKAHDKTVINNNSLVKNLTLNQILNVNLFYDNDLIKYAKKHKIISKKNMSIIYNDFKNFINKHYPQKVIIYLLKQFKNYGKNNWETAKKNIRKKLGVNIDVSMATCFEFTVDVALYYYSNCKINLYLARNLKLENFKPKQFATGNQPDFCSYNPKTNTCILGEATLMNKNVQPKGEFFPDIKHNIDAELNLLKKHKNAKTITYYVAVQKNVNLFKDFLGQHNIIKYINNSNGKIISHLNGIDIIPFNINTFINLLEKNLQNPKKYNLNNLNNLILYYKPLRKKLFH